MLFSVNVLAFGFAAFFIQLFLAFQAPVSSYTTCVKPESLQMGYRFIGAKGEGRRALLNRFTDYR